MLTYAFHKSNSRQRSQALKSRSLTSWLTCELFGQICFTSSMECSCCLDACCVLLQHCSSKAPVGSQQEHSRRAEKYRGQSLLKGVLNIPEELLLVKSWCWKKKKTNFMKWNFGEILTVAWLWNNHGMSRVLKNIHRLMVHYTAYIYIHIHTLLFV